MALLGRAQEKLTNGSELAANGQCQIWKGATSKTGYGVTKIKGRQYYVHRLSYMINTDQEHLPERVNDVRFDCSHLCHNKLCTNAAHISFEPHSINNTRQACLHANHCPGSHVLNQTHYPDCTIDTTRFFAR